MTTFDMLSAASGAAVTISLFFILFFLCAVYCIAYRNVSSRYEKIAGAACIAALLMLLCLLRENRWSKMHGEGASQAVSYAGNISIVLIFVFMASAAIFGFRLLLRVLRYQKNVVTKDSIKESADNLPVGLCFAKKNGFVLLANSRMEKLSQQLTGVSLQDGGAFWECVSDGSLSEGKQRIFMDDTPSILMENGEVWNFSRKVIEVSGTEVMQILATDTTELYRLLCERKIDNEILRDMNTGLHKYSDTVEELTHTRERLATKVRIHDEIGQNLMATKYFLLKGDKEKEMYDIIDKWKRSVAVLKREAKPEEFTGVMKYLTDAADTVGVEVALSGELPEEGAAIELIIAAGAEALTNAVRHADAKKLQISVSDMSVVYVVEFTNDGKSAGSMVREGGGLSSLRKRVEDAGGIMSVSAEPEFMLRITIPKERRYVL